jgi:hypothetical protein
MVWYNPGTWFAGDPEAKVKAAQAEVDAANAKLEAAKAEAATAAAAPDKEPQNPTGATDSGVTSSPAMGGRRRNKKTRRGKKGKSRKARKTH